MPSLELTAFGFSEVRATRIASGQCSLVARGATVLPFASGRHSTNPPKIDRQAEPDPERASEARSASPTSIRAAARAALARAANVEADEAKPAATGKFDTSETRAWRSM